MKTRRLSEVARNATTQNGTRTGPPRVCVPSHTRFAVFSTEPGDAQRRTRTRAPVLVLARSGRTKSRKKRRKNLSRTSGSAFRPAFSLAAKRKQRSRAVSRTRRMDPRERARGQLFL